MRNFAHQRRPGQFQIQVFDKALNRIFTTAIENIAVESDFNALERDGVRLSLEAGMGAIESAAAGPISRIVQRGTLAGMADEGRSALDLFVTLQFMRGTGFRAQFADLAGVMARRVRAMAMEKGWAEPAIEEGSDELKFAALQLIAQSLFEFVGRFHDKNLLLLEAAEEQEFLLGDNPVTMQNERNFGPYGNIGLGLAGIEIYLPISSRLSLAYWCPSILEGMRAGLVEADRRVSEAQVLAVLGVGLAGRAAAGILPELLATRERLRRVSQSQAAGVAIAASTDNVTRLNSLQVRWSERFVMSKEGGFDIVRHMIADNDAYRQGVRVRAD